MKMRYGFGHGQLTRRIGAFALSASLAMSMFAGLSQSTANAQEPKASKSSNTVAERTGMPTKGDVKPLVVRVGFPEYPLDSDKAGEAPYPEDILLGMIDGGIEGEDMSLHSFYETSSYGQLNITAGQVFSYTTIHERDYYCDEMAGKYEEAPDTDPSDMLNIYYSEDGAAARRNVDPGDDDEEMPKRQFLLVDEILEALDDEIDYTDYDADLDGKIDTIIINFAGPRGAWSTTWWPHASARKNSDIYDGVQYGSYTFIHNMVFDDNYHSDIMTLCHETGHLLGIPDYYTYGNKQKNGIATFDLMSTVKSDHCAFNKWTYGWYDDDEVEFLDKETVENQGGEVTVHLSPADADTKSGTMIAVIAPENAEANGIFSTYFLVEYDEGQFLNKQVMEINGYEPGFRIFQVNAVLNPTGKDYFKSDNDEYDDSDRLIYSVKQCGDYTMDDTFFREGDEFTPESEPNSRFYIDSSKVGKATGICITDFVTGEDPSFKVSFVDVEEEEIEVEFNGKKDGLGNTLDLKLYPSVPLDIADIMLTRSVTLVDDDGNVFPLSMIEMNDEELYYHLTYTQQSPSLTPNTQYYVVFPEGLFSPTEGTILPETRVPVTTGDFTELEEVARTLHDESYRFESHWTAGGDNKAVKLSGTYDGENIVLDVDMLIVDSDGNESIIEGIKLPVIHEDGDELREDYLGVDVTLYSLSDGTIVAEFDYLDRKNFYHLDTDGNLLGNVRTINNNEQMNFSVSGTYMLGSYYSYVDDTPFFAVFDFEDKFDIIPQATYLGKYCGIDSEKYARMMYDRNEGKFYLVIFDMDGNEISKNAVVGRHTGMISDGEFIYYYEKEYDDDLNMSFMLYKADLDGNVLSGKDVTEELKDIESVWDETRIRLALTADGIYVEGLVQSGYYQFRYVSFFDDDFEKIGSRVLMEGESLVPLDNCVMNIVSAYIRTEPDPLNLYRRMFFKAEEVIPDVTPDDNTESGTESTVPAKDNTPKTGDKGLGIWLALAVISGGFVLATGRKEETER